MVVGWGGDVGEQPDSSVGVKAPHLLTRGYHIKASDDGQ